MKMTFRWFGAGSDPIPLEHIKQIPGMTGIMGVLDDKAAGEIWLEEEIRALTGRVSAAGLECEVIESVNVHEDIKLGLPTRDRYIENYCTTIRNLARCGVKVIIYNFMPVFDWLRTDLARLIEADGSNSLYFDEQALGDLGPLDIVRQTVENANGFSLPGWEPDRLAELEATLERYASMTAEQLRGNLQYFLQGILPTCEQWGVVMACHPDDPAWPIFGLPRIAHSLEDYLRVIALSDSPANTACLCTGSLASDAENDIPAIIRRLGEMNRV